MSDTQKAFFKDGVLPIKNLISNVWDLNSNIPRKKICSEYHAEYDQTGNLLDEFDYELQVPGSYSRTCYPEYKQIYEGVMKSLQSHFLPDVKLFPTYWFDRVYYPGLNLKRHTDWEACEISVTIQLSTSLTKPWTFYAETKSGKEIGFDMNNGDAVLYAGHDVEHWRECMPGSEDDYHHQLFFHYVIFNGKCYNTLKNQGHVEEKLYHNYRREQYK